MPAGGLGHGGSPEGVARQELLEEVGGTAADLRYVGQFYTTNGISNEVAHVVAEETIQKMDNIAREYQLPPWHTSLMEAWQARIWLAQDKLEVAFQRVRERGLDANKDLTDQDEIAYITLARILIAQGGLERATTLLRRLLEAAGAGERITRAIGLTNREVASRLFISLNTVKAHCRNIYGKLGVNNRTQAIGRARALGTLPST